MAPSRTRPLQYSTGAHLIVACVVMVGCWLPTPPVWSAPEANEFVTKTWMVEDGLPNDSVNRIVFDARGVLWVASGSGLARFDGRDFREYPVPRIAETQSRNVRSLSMVPDGLLLLPASGGVIEWREGAFVVHPVTALLKDETLTDVFGGPDRALWIGTATSQLLRWQDGHLQRFGAPEGITRRADRFTFAVDDDGATWVAGYDFLDRWADGKLVRTELGFDDGIVIAEARGGGIWVADRHRLAKIKRGVVVTEFEGAAWRAVAASGIQALSEDDGDTLWIGTRRQGIYRFARSELASVPVPYRIVKSIACDHDGNVFVATGGGGLQRLRRRNFELLNTAVGFPDDVSTSVCKDETGALWCANRAGGVVRYTMGKAEIVPPPSSDMTFAISVCPDHEGNVFVGTSHGLFRVPVNDRSQTETMFQSGVSVHVLFCARDGTLWVGCGDGTLRIVRNGRVSVIALPAPNRGEHLRGIAEDRGGRTWVAVEGGQLLVCDHGAMQVGIPGGLHAGEIASLYCDADDNLWCATSEGLALKTGGTVHLFTVAEGLPDSELSQVLEDARGRLWCGSRRGIFSVEKSDLLDVASGKARQLRTTILGGAEGLHGTSALIGGQPMVWRDKNEIWMATYKGVVGFRPTDFAQHRESPPLFFDALVVDGHEVPLAPNVRIGPDVGEVEFKLLALDYATPQSIRLRHQLIGFDRDWVQTPDDRRASYARLAPGHYTFRAEASREGASWNDQPVALELIVTPNWTQTMWFEAGVLSLGIVLVGALARAWSHRRLRLRLENLEREHALERERSRIARNLHDDLGSSLTQIGMLADRMRRHAIDPTLKSKLALLAAKTRRAAGELESIVWTVNPKNHTWDRLANYLKRFAQGYCHDSEIVCSVEDTELVPAVPISPEVQHNVLGVVKESLSNVVKHAIATQVEVRFLTTPNHIEISVRDNGRGFDLAAASLADRNGLTNMRARMAAIGGSIIVQSEPGAGTTVRLSVPIAPAGMAPTASTK